jgi:HD-GYP domain-containing protein (c-di-GMP phosphodiesterase class II)
LAGLGYRWVVSDVTPRVERVRAAEVIGALCLATDLGMGFPFEHGLQSTLIAIRLADRFGVDPATASQTYYACLLSHSGCTTDAHVTPKVYGGSLTTHFHPLMYGSGRDVLTGLIRALPDPESAGPVRAGQIARRLPKMVREQRPHLTATCEVAGMLAEELGLSGSVGDLLAHLFERWDGWGPLRRAKEDEIPLPMRIVHLAVDAAFQRMLGGEERVVRLVRERAGHAFDPELAACLVDDAGGILALDARASVWEETLSCEPPPPLLLDREALDRGLAAMGNFADLISPYLAGHSAGVADLATAAGQRCRVDAADTTMLRRAALVHDLGRVAIGAGIWQKRGPLNADEWEQVRLHPYHTERVLSRSPFLSALAPVAGAHHERLDGSGYHRAVAGAELAFLARLLAAADAYHAMTEPRPYRDPIAPERAAEILGEEASAGRLDADAVTAVVESAGQRAPRIERPAGLTEREAEVVAMLARGLQTKEVAGTLGISVKTADRHIQNAYRKIGVSTRAAATLFAMEHGLLAWGEFPIGRPAVRP